MAYMSLMFLVIELVQLIARRYQTDSVASRLLSKPPERPLQLSSAAHRSWVPSSQSSGISYLYSLSDHSTESANPLHFL